MVNANAYLASPPIRLTAEEQQANASHAAGGRTQLSPQRESKVYRMTASQVQVNRSARLRSDQDSARYYHRHLPSLFPNGLRHTCCRCCKGKVRNHTNTKIPRRFARIGGKVSAWQWHRRTFWSLSDRETRGAMAKDLRTKRLQVTDGDEGVEMVRAMR